MLERGPEERCRPGTDRLLRLLVENSSEYAVFVMDPEGNVLTWNEGARISTGYVADEIIGRHVGILYPSELPDPGEPGRAFAIAAAQDRFEETTWRRRKDGSHLRAHVIVTALRDEEGELVGFGEVTRDLSERRTGQQVLRESEDRFRMLVQSVKDYGIFMLDPQGRVASWNEGAEALKGYAADEILGRHFSAFYPPEDLAWDKPAMELEVAAAEGRFEDEGWRLRKDGSRFWANVIITPVRDAHGALVGFSKVTRDLTERRARQEQAIEDARRVADAEAANRAKGEFLAAMSHELRTPLNAIGGFVDLLAMGIRGPVTEQQIGDLERVRRSQQHLLGIINDLLNFSRMEAGQVSYTLGDVPLAQVVARVRPMIEPLAAAKAIELAWPGGESEEVGRADASKLEQILLNLLTNAVKFTGEGGRITVSTGIEGDCAILRVEDTGIGIEADRMADIFEPFVQVGRSLGSPHEGTGLGLAISRDLARAMGGDLSVESRLGEGSTFTVLLPRAQEARAGGR